MLNFNSLKKILFILCLIKLLFIFSCSSNLQLRELSNSFDNTDLASPSDSLEKETDPPKLANLKDKTNQNWKITKQKLSNDDFIDAVFVDDDNGWIVSIKGDELIPEGGNIYKTNDGGKNWKKLQLKLQDESFISKIFFLDKLHGWIIIQTLDNEKRGIETQIQILETLNGGESWKPSFNQKNAFVSKITINEKGEGWIVGLKGKATYSGNADALALHTLDFGKTWIDVSPKFVIENKENPSQEILTSDSLADVFPINAETATILTKRGEILKTINGGKTWQNVIQLIDEEYSFGFQRIEPLKDSDFLAISGASGPEGTWNLFTVFNESKIKDKFVLGGVFVESLAILSKNEFVACGFKNGLNETKTKADSGNIVLFSKDLENWETIYKSSEGCNLGCGFNKIVKLSDNKLLVLGKNGFLILLTSKK